MSDLRAFGFGLVAFVLLTVAYLGGGSMVRDPPQVIAWAIAASIYVAPALAGFVCILRRPKHQFQTLLVLGLAASAALGVLNFAWGELGYPVDLGGADQILLVTGLSLIAVVPLTVVGGAVSAFVIDFSSKTAGRGAAK